MERIADAAHNMEHFYRDCAFDVTLFNERMRASLYKTKARKGTKPSAAAAITLKPVGAIVVKHNYPKPKVSEDEPAADHESAD